MSFIETINVLLVDDDRFLTSLYQRNTEKHERIDLNIAHDGVYALELIRAGYEPHVILLDINMPGMSGVDVLRVIRTEGLVPDAMVLVVSNAFEDDYREDFRLLEIDEFIHKASMLPSRVLGRMLELVEARQRSEARDAAEDFVQDDEPATDDDAFADRDLVAVF